MSTDGKLYNKTRNYIFGKGFAELVFLAGIAIHRDILPSKLEKRWLKFMRDEMRRLFEGELMTDDQYTEINDYICELATFLVGDRESESRLTADMVEEARKQRPKDG